MEKLQLGGQRRIVKKKSKVRFVRYGECERNHAVKDGGYAVDGCKEFIASDENGGSPLTCSCCGCHMNYHRIVEETDQESFGVGEQKKRKRRELKSKVWDDFTRFTDEDGNEWAICKHCKGQYGGSSADGTTHLKMHLASMKCRAKRNGGDGIEDVSTQIRDLATLTPVLMKEKPSVIDLIKQRFYEDGKFIEHWDPSVLNSRKDEILKVYQEEKEKQGKLFSNLSCRFSLHIYHFIADIVMLMVHFIDDSWERQNKIISIVSWENYIQETKKSCLDLKIDRNISSIQSNVSDRDDDNEEIIESWFSQRGSFPFVGVGLDFLHFEERIALFINTWEMNEIDGLRECVTYGYKTPSNNLRLQLAVNNAKTMGKKVIFNDHLSLLCFDSPFEYLELAVGLKEAFSELEKIDSDFIPINLTSQKWDEATATFEHFEALKEFVDDFRWDNCSSITTKVVDILKLFRFHNSEDCQVCKNASYKNLFDKIQVYLVLVILDPRFKMDTIQRCYKEIYGSDADGYLEKILKDFRDVYNEYAKESSGEDYKMMDAKGRPCTSSTKSELELYLHHLKVPAVEGFDILAWWRGNAPFYPTLARMARDYLTILINQIFIDLPLIQEMYAIDYCLKIDVDIKSSLKYLKVLLSYQARSEGNK